MPAVMILGKRRCEAEIRDLEVGASLSFGNYSVTLVCAADTMESLFEPRNLQTVGWLLLRLTSECGEWRSRRSPGRSMTIITVHCRRSSLPDFFLFGSYLESWRTLYSVVWKETEGRISEKRTVLDVEYCIAQGSRMIICLLSEIIPEVLPMLEATENTSFLSSSVH
jgi:hypothetical protein